MRKDSKKVKCMHSLSVSVCPFLSETMCPYFLYGHMWLHFSDVLPCPDLQLKTTSSSCWDSSPMSFFNLKYLFCGSWRRKPQKDLRKSHKSPFVVVLNTMCSLGVNISVVRTTALDKGQEQAYLWVTWRIICSMSSLWVPDLQSSQHCREQGTGVTPTWWGN